jgi:hypothetical protein
MLADHAPRKSRDDPNNNEGNRCNDWPSAASPRPCGVGLRSYDAETSHVHPPVREDSTKIVEFVGS